MDIEALAFNTAISRFIATKELAAMGCTSKTVLTYLAQMMSPFAPHICEQIGARRWGTRPRLPLHLGRFDDAYAVDNTVTIGVQILGKTHGQITIAPDADENTALSAAKSVEAIAKASRRKSSRPRDLYSGRILNLILK